MGALAEARVWLSTGQRSSRKGWSAQVAKRSRLNRGGSGMRRPEQPLRTAVMRSERVRLRMEMEKAGKKEIVVAVSPERERERKREPGRENMGWLMKIPVGFLGTSSLHTLLRACLHACLLARSYPSRKVEGLVSYPPGPLNHCPSLQKLFPSSGKSFWSSSLYAGGC